MSQRRYITRRGFDALRAELHQLVAHERPRTVVEASTAAAHGDRSENYEYKFAKKKLREIDGKLHRLQKLLESFEVVDPATRPKTARAFFGATVTVEDEDGDARAYQLVGVEEQDAGAGRISHESPLGRALLGRRRGEVVVVRRPKGDVELTILRVDWK